MAPGSVACNGCGEKFPSKNAVFRHLKATDGACLSEADRDEFDQYVLDTQKREKVVILYGYWIDPSSSALVRNGDDVAKILLEVLEQVGSADVSTTETTTTKEPSAEQQQSGGKVNRSYGHQSRGTAIVAQDDGTSAITEVLATRLPPIPLASVHTIEQWLQQVNDALWQRCNGDDSSNIRVFGRQSMPISKFNAELDVSRRRVEYLLPADFLFPGNNESSTEKTLQEFYESLPSFAEGDNSNMLKAETLTFLTSLKRTMQSLTTHIVELDTKDPAQVFEKEFHDQKRHHNKVYNNMSKTRPRPVDKNRKSALGSADTKEEADNTLNEMLKSLDCRKAKKNSDGNDTGKKQHMLQRKHYHNFTPTAMAHEYLSYRRLDRFYHRATLRFDVDGPASGVLVSSSNGNATTMQQEQQQRPFLALSMSGDMFLNGQACRLVGLFIAMARGMVDQDFIDCVFDESYPHLVPTPAAPSIGMYAGHVFYIHTEGKVKAILTPRKCDRFKNGWGDPTTIQMVQDWQAVVRSNVAKAWQESGVSSDGRLVAEKHWTEKVLIPWAQRAQAQLRHYRAWKASSAATTKASYITKEPATVNMTCGKQHLLPETYHVLQPIQSANVSVPPIFEKVLQHLREADASGLWPSTTPKRQLVMVSNVIPVEGINGNSGKASLTIEHMKAKINDEIRPSAYSFAEGGGGASGSFSIGVMPGDKCLQPKANALFPELMKAAFELEIALCPDREPSSTIAVNRNAQFRPHTDNGAGAGQSTSLIVGLGNYSGGELVVEGEQKDILYNAVEFNGWKQRHWTMPFEGERYSLVWFTPKGCEGVRGIDLCR